MMHPAQSYTEDISSSSLPTHSCPLPTNGIPREVLTVYQRIPSNPKQQEPQHILLSDPHEPQPSFPPHPCYCSFTACLSLSLRSGLWSLVYILRYIETAFQGADEVCGPQGG